MSSLHPTKKELKELKAAKKAAQQRSESDRKQELEPVMNKFAELGISEEIEEVSQFFQIARTFISNGIGSSGKIPISAIGREIQYILTNNKLHQIMVVLHKME